MKLTDREECKRAYIEGVKLNHLNKNLLAQLHMKSLNAIEKYLYVKNRYPDFKDLLELFYFLKSTGGAIPISISRLMGRSRGRAISVAKSHGMYIAVAKNRKYVGKLKRPNKYTYILNGRRVSRQDLVSEKGLSLSTVKIRLKGIEDEGDISHIDFTHKNNWSFKKAPK